MKGRCYLCGSEATIEGTEDHVVVCKGGCGAYLITPEARRELGVTPGTLAGYVRGRKRALLIRLRRIRKGNPDQRIRVARALSVKIE